MLKLGKIIEFFTSVLLIFAFSFPRVLPNIKIAMLAILLGLVLISKRLNPQAFQRIFIYALFFIVPILAASIYGNQQDYIVSLFKVYFLFPAMLIIIFQVFDRQTFYRILYKAASVSLVIITFVSLTTLLQGLGYFPVNVNAYFYEDEDRIGLNEGYIHIINSPLSYYLFLIPIVFNNGKNFDFTNKKLYFFIALFIFSILTGRRILLLPFIIIIVAHFRKFYKLFLVGIVIGFLFLSSSGNKFENFDIGFVFDRFKSAINNEGDSAVREEQSNYFEKYISERPIAGYGLGSYMGSYLRNDLSKTAYERSYHYLVFTVGIPFAIVLFGYYIYLLYSMWRYGNGSDHNKGIFIGLVSLLLASYTNPYWLSSFDYTIPFAILIVLSLQPHIWKKFSVS